MVCVRWWVRLQTHRLEPPTTMPKRLFIAPVAAILGLACLACPARSQDKTSSKKGSEKAASGAAKDTASQDSAAVKRVRQAHDALFRYLGDDDNARGWKTFLMSDQLA